MNEDIQSQENCLCLVSLLGLFGFSLPRLPMCTVGVLPCPGPRAIRIKQGPICPVPFWPKLYYRLTHQPLVYPASETPVPLPSTCACLGASSLR